MKYVFILFIGVLLTSCGTKIPFTNNVKEEFSLETEQSMAKVQFYTSATIKLERSKESGNQGTTSDGALVTNSNKEQDVIVIPIGTKCVFERLDEENIVVRFEPGLGHTISFGVRQGQASGKYYLLADWTNTTGGEVEYGKGTYFATTSSGTAYLQVVRKKLAKTKRKERFVKGMKV
ncbi:MAG: hypothetical protein ACI837_002417 [Crocinitomicaceae bacterium]|jgi:hypothetical protein